MAPSLVKFTQRPLTPGGGRGCGLVLWCWEVSEAGLPLLAAVDAPLVCLQ